MSKKLTPAALNAWLNQLPEPLEKPKKLTVGDGLYLMARPASKRRRERGEAHGAFWRLRYVFAGKETMIGLGRYPAVSLKLARDRRDEARRLLEQGRNPATAADWTKAARRAAAAQSANTFKSVADAWFADQTWSPNTRVRNERVLGYLNGIIGTAPVHEIDARAVLDALRAIEKFSPEAAKRGRQLAGAVFTRAILDGLATHNPAAGLHKAIKSTPSTPHPAITDPKKLGALLRAIDAYDGQPATRAALQLLALTFVRPGELRLSTWREFDLKRGQWVVPLERMKMRRQRAATEHVVPLAKQAVTILSTLKPITDHGPGSYVLPSLRPRRPLSDNTMNTALRSLGYDTRAEHCSHGFRSTASTLLHEMGFPPDVIEAQLAHRRPGVGGIYNRSHRLAERRKMMQRWADELDRLRKRK